MQTIIKIGNLEKIIYSSFYRKFLTCHKTNNLETKYVITRTTSVMQCGCIFIQRSVVCKKKRKTTKKLRIINAHIRAIFRESFIFMGGRNNKSRPKRVFEIKVVFKCLLYINISKLLFFCYLLIAVSCGSNLIALDRSKTITSPSYPQQYRHNMTCTWTITAASNYLIDITNIRVSSDSCCEILQVRVLYSITTGCPKKMYTQFK